MLTLPTMAPVSRRSFLAGLIAAPVLATAVIEAQPVPAPPVEPVDGTLTGRILRTLKHRKELGLKNAAIMVSAAGHELIQVEHGCEPEPLMDLSIRGVPCFRVPDITEAHDYWVLEKRPEIKWLGRIHG